MKCHGGAIASQSPNAVKRVVLIGMPNCGKSTLFNRITGASAFVGNWSGVTVDLLQATIPINGKVVEFVDLPGIYDLNSFSDDEKVVTYFLETFQIDLVLVILNAAQIDRQIRLPLQLKALGLPSIVLLNMADEAQRYGIEIQTEELSQRLDLPVFLLSAKQGKGLHRVQEAIAKTLETQSQSYTVNNLKDCLSNAAPITSEIMTEVLQGLVTFPSDLKRSLTSQLDRILLDPIAGLPLFFLGMFLVFYLIWTVGLPSQDIMGFITQWFQDYLLKPIIHPLPSVIQDFLINGIWNGVSTVASFLPLIFLFFVMMAILEDSGYLSRCAYLMDGLMARLGLDGRSFVMQIMGFGCNVPALMGTRILRSRSLRLLTMLIIPFSVCSARLQVFVFIIAAIFPGIWGAIALFSLYLLSFMVALIVALLLRGVFKNDEPFVLELPPYRFPTLRHIFVRSWGEVWQFLSRASGFILLGCIAVWFLTNLPPGTTGLATIGGQIGQLLSPVMAPIGIDPYLTLALIFGIIAKEVVVGSLAVIYGLNSTLIGQHLAVTVTPIQAYSFCIFCLLYLPCLTTTATLWNESKSWQFTLFSAVFSLVFAWVMSFLFYQGALFF
ncbi:MAG TPA: ferrous iron transport protein B [Cyanobacteria bacterium UBA11149]|nr:ferrous iron transport protein B [Cyanobacteria bacterium UBA11367]HBE56441.1 ferrous iron transport protein B [Cyanobacteria bacterium UBA11366]HBK64806.1 ferrous iron transport protein B [Cyanobacteria bacterium UBA11166]HBR77277.1 ferrous iron transport protein B [Cyanobacteria bacterium UBA11159]HBS70428.1 ferrous iron transport protein B [Cyanobacteria bacterium UBA11153]HBW87760.1 ferrous iron transport protein B [Cyanobacteria bacterium UBA11149]HCA94757.1 ferrous iron transport pro